MIDTGRLEEIQREIEVLREEALEIVSDTRHQGDPLIFKRAYEGWSAEIQTALSRHNEWVGQISMDTLEETIEACDELNSAVPEEDAA